MGFSVFGGEGFIGREICKDSDFVSLPKTIRDKEGVYSVFGKNSHHVKDKSGKTFGALYVINVVGRAKNGSAVYACRCECGKEINVDGGNLQDDCSYIRSCGCKRSNITSPARKSKICSRCKTEKPINEFAINRSRRDEHSQFCLVCKRDIDLAYQSTKGRSDYGRKWQKSKRDSSPAYRIRQNLCRRINTALHRTRTDLRKSHKTLDYVGCDVATLVAHLESTFSSEMSWENYGTYWHVDHIKPCALFDLTDEDEQRRCFHYTNLQALEKHENVQKGMRYDGER